MEKINWSEIQDAIEDAIFCSLEIDGDEVYDMFIMKTVNVYFIVIEDLDSDKRLKKQISEEMYIKLTKE